MTNPKLYKACLRAVGGVKYKREAIEMMRLAEQAAEIGFEETEYPETKVIEKNKYE